MLAVVASQDISNLATPPTNEESKWAGSKAPVDINLQQAGMTGASTACHWPPRGCPQALCLVGSRGLTELARTLPSLNFGSNKLIWAGLVPMERYDRSHKEQGSASVQCQDRKPGTVRGTRVLICYPSNGLARGILGCPRYPTQPYTGTVFTVQSVWLFRHNRWTRHSSILWWNNPRAGARNFGYYCIGRFNLRSGYRDSAKPASSTKTELNCRVQCQCERNFTHVSVEPDSMCLNHARAPEVSCVKYSNYVLSIFIKTILIKFKSIHSVCNDLVF